MKMFVFAAMWAFSLLLCAQEGPVPFPRHPKDIISYLVDSSVKIEDRQKLIALIYQGQFFEKDNEKKNFILLLDGVKEKMKELTGRELNLEEKKTKNILEVILSWEEDISGQSCADDKENCQEVLEKLNLQELQSLLQRKEINERNALIYAIENNAHELNFMNFVLSYFDRKDDENRQLDFLVILKSYEKINIDIFKRILTHPGSLILVKKLALEKIDKANSIHLLGDDEWNEVIKQSRALLTKKGNNEGKYFLSILVHYYPRISYAFLLEYAIEKFDIKIFNLLISLNDEQTVEKLNDLFILENDFSKKIKIIEILSDKVRGNSIKHALILIEEKERTVGEVRSITSLLLKYHLFSSGVVALFYRDLSLENISIAFKIIIERLTKEEVNVLLSSFLTSMQWDTNVELRFLEIVSPYLDLDTLKEMLKKVKGTEGDIQSAVIEISLACLDKEKDRNGLELFWSEVDKDDKKILVGRITRYDLLRKIYDLANRTERKIFYENIKSFQAEEKRDFFIYVLTRGDIRLKEGREISDMFVKFLRKSDYQKILKIANQDIKNLVVFLNDNIEDEDKRRVEEAEEIQEWFEASWEKLPGNERGQKIIAHSFLKEIYSLMVKHTYSSLSEDKVFNVFLKISDLIFTSVFPLIHFKDADLANDFFMLAQNILKKKEYRPDSILLKMVFIRLKREPFQEELKKGHVLETEESKDLWSFLMLQECLLARECYLRGEDYQKRLYSLLGHPKDIPLNQDFILAPKREKHELEYETSRLQVNAGIYTWPSFEKLIIQVDKEFNFSRFALLVAPLIVDDRFQLGQKSLLEIKGSAPEFLAFHGEVTKGEVPLKAEMGPPGAPDLYVDVPVKKQRCVTRIKFGFGSVCMKREDFVEVEKRLSRAAYAGADGEMGKAGYNGADIMMPGKNNNTLISFLEGGSGGEGGDPGPANGGPSAGNYGPNGADGKNGKIIYKQDIDKQDQK
jgi:hypothetical protein